MIKKEVYICVDAGGTTSKAAIFSKDGKIFKRGYSESGSPAVNHETWYFNIDQAIEDALSNHQNDYTIQKIAIGVSGISALNDSNFVKRYFEEKYSAKCVITSDTMTALYAVLGAGINSGIVVISGTGIAIFGKKQNQTALAGGWGHLIREKGSSYALVHDFCVKMIDKYEASKPFNSLEKAFLSYLKIKNIRELNHIFYQHTKDEIAKLSLFLKKRQEKIIKKLFIKKGRF